MSDLSSQPTPLQTIYNWYRSTTLTVNRAYQRKLVWTLEEKQKLIDSILKDYPIPLVLLAETTYEGQPQLEIIYGLQRLHTIVSFIEHGFSTMDGSYFNVDEFTRAKEEREKQTFKESDSDKRLSRSEVSKILDYILPVSIIRHASEEVVTDVFGRINSYGHRLSDQERRQAGLVSDLARFVRTLSAEIRGDVSVDRLPLTKMPEISIDLASTKYGYKVQASDVFWVRQGILRSTELRDSLDEQALADLVACVLSDKLVERSKDALDDLYNQSSPESASITSRLRAYPPEKLASEVKYCIEIVDKIANHHSAALRNLVFDQSRSTNSFPTVFSVIFMAIYELSFKLGLLLANPEAANHALKGVHARLNTSRNALSIEERRLNINIVKGLLNDSFVQGDVGKVAFGIRRELDISNTLRRSEIETPSFEMKQGILRLSNDRALDESTFDKVIATASAIANIGPRSQGMIFIGVADKESDADRITELDGIEPTKIGHRWIVGIDREAKVLGFNAERYFHTWRDKIDQADLTQALKSDLLGAMDLVLLGDKHLLLLNVPTQKAVSVYRGKVFTRDGDQTREASIEASLAMAARFARDK